MADENTPLLSPRRTSRQAHWILFILCTVIVTIDFAGYLSIAPQTQILEDIICRDLHPDAAASASICKDVDVQSELALLTGWKETFDQLPGIVLALPFGFMADRIGRKKVAILSLVGLIMQEISLRIICWNSPAIPPRTIWFTALFQICGGGPLIATSMVFTIITDIYPVEKRTNKFFIVAAAALTAEILANPISAFLMTKSPWLPYFLTLVCALFSLAVLLFIPETLPKALHADHDSAAASATDEDGDDDGQDSLVRTVFRSALTQLLRIREFIWNDKNVLTISAAFFAGNVGQQALRLLLQYASKRFGWSLAKASILISLKGIINLALLLVILPTLSHLLSKRLPPIPKDLLIARASAFLLVLGLTLMAFAPRPPLFILGITILALGWGFYAALRSVASALVSEDHIGLLNTTIALVQGIGAVMAGPAMAGAFGLGMRMGGGWIGLPYLVGAILVAGAGGLTGVVRLEPR
ncbi:major facilitator superfamily domain-containing protein [Aspergillus granulosus]|uniref:Major facilitator superfamily domain-containing protein n=1 Tax=Aspergillus granulosus TaxID=176169 RepID=A0ABR4HRF2_9EURO